MKGILALCLWFLGTTIYGQTNDLNFYYIKENKKVYNSQHKVLHIDLDKKDISNHLWEIKTGNDDTYYFINNDLIKKGESFILNDSLFKLYSSSNIHFTVNKNNINTPIVIEDKTITEENQEETESNLRKGLGYQDYLTTVFVFILVIISIVRLITGREFLEIFNIRSILSSKNKDEYLFRNKILSQNSLLYFLMLSMMASFIIVFITNGDIYTSLFSTLLLDWLINSLIVFIFIYLLSIYTWFFSYIYNMKKLFNIHFYNYMRFNQLAVIILVLVVFYLSWMHVDYNANIFFLNAVISFSLIRSFIVFIKLNSEVGYKYYHLFSYLCATELLPIFGLWYIWD